MQQTKTLFVDDEPDLEHLIRQKYRKMLRSGDIALDFARNGREALEKLQDDREVAVVMTDINMPEMDGLTLLNEIKKLDREMPIVIISAYGDMTNIRTAMNRGAFDFLTKPIEFDDLEITRQKAQVQFLKIQEKFRLQKEKHRLEERVKFIRDVFGRYLSDSVVRQLLEAPDGLELGGAKREVTILMSDIRGFSPIAERLPPEESIKLLNHYFEIMIDIIIDHGGTIDELLGDAILVIFGAPLTQQDHALRATACAIDMQLALEKVNRDNEAQGLPRIEMGIGINTGEVVVGNIGSKKRSKYGVVGEQVNLTARIETHAHGRQVLISENTLRHGGSLLRTGEALEFEAKGFSRPVKVFSLSGIGGGYDRELPVAGLENALRS